MTPAESSDEGVNATQVPGVLSRLVKVVERMEKDIYSTDPNSPGLALRFDRIEQQGKTIKWLLSGGVVTLGASTYFLWKIMSLMGSTALPGGG